LAGQEPPAWLRAKASRRVQVTGGVSPLQLSAYYRNASLIVIPLTLGGGIKNKFLEAMSYGKAILSTKKGAEGIDAIPGKDFWLSKPRARVFAMDLLYLLDNKKLRTELGRSAYLSFTTAYGQNRLTELIAHELCRIGLARHP
ncbi:MAG: glycosyltransferase, partial [Acidithiobacillus sp.]|nr:glycosyltransferase [Acidithiobacillus sp.]